MKLAKIPTGIKTFDVNINEGFPGGSVILILEDVGAGGREFIYTSIYNLNQIKADSINYDPMNKKINKVRDDQIVATIMIPDKICYVSISKSKEDILRGDRPCFP